MKRHTLRLLPMIWLGALIASGCADSHAPSEQDVPAAAATAVSEATEDQGGERRPESQDEEGGLGQKGKRFGRDDRDTKTAEPESAAEAAPLSGHAPAPMRKRPASVSGTGRGYGKSPGAGAPRHSGSTGSHATATARPQHGRLADQGVLASGRYPDMYFQHYGVNPTIDTDEQARSTFAIDVDTASYTMARSFLERGSLPAEAAIRVEEVVNAFDYGYQAPRGDTFSVYAEAAPSPNRRGYHVLHIGIKGKDVAKAERKRASLIFVVDVSGSMDSGNRLGLVKRSLRLLVGQLDEADQVGIVTYGSTARAVLSPTTAFHRQRILRVIDALHTEGATNAEAGLRLGYQMAGAHRLEGGINRVVLCSDGVANVGHTGPESILEVIGRQARRGITISTVGVGMGNYNDVLMERLADKGNGNYYYIDKLDEARRVFVEKLTGTLQVIAKDVKIQVAFDPEVVRRYRLIGYENRKLTSEQFSDDRVDAGEVGAGHAVTAIYEVKLRAGNSGALGRVRIRYQAPSGGASRLIEQTLSRSIVRSSDDSLSSPTQLSLVAAELGEKLRGSYWVRNLGYDDILRRFERIAAPLRRRADVQDLERLVKRARDLDKRGDKFISHGPLAMMDFDHVPVLR